jgi:hypothetical protein
MYTFLLNGFDFTKLVYSTPVLTKRVGKGSQSLTNDLSINVINEENVFSAENENSLIYEFRDDYSKIEVEVMQGDTSMWKGIVDDIIRDPLGGTASIKCVEVTIKLLNVSEFMYYDGDGYIGTMAFAGATATPADHILAILRRYLSDSNIDLGSIKALKQFHLTNLIACDCEIRNEGQTKVSPLTFIQNLMINTGYIGVYKNKIFVKVYEEFLGDFGIVLKDDIITDIISISKSKGISNEPYSAFSIIYSDSSTPTVVEGSVGDTGITSNLASTYLEDDSKDWTVNQWKDYYVFIDEYDTKQILKITGNNKTRLYFAGCTKMSPMSYVICETNKIFTQDWSDYPIKLISGAMAIGTLIVTKNSNNKLEISLQIQDTMEIDIGDSVTISIIDEGIVAQPFEVTQTRKELYGTEDLLTITCIDKIMYPLQVDYSAAPPVKVTGLIGFRLEDGAAVLSWTAVPGVSYYKVFYGTTNPDYVMSTTAHEDVIVVDHLERWLGYFFWVVAVNFYGIEGEKSDSLFLAKVSQESGYIDGTEGYLIEDYEDWGRMEDFYFALTYKNIASSDIGFLLKGSLIILDRSQSTSVEEISQVFADTQAIEKWGESFRRLGYIDGAGTSNYLPEFSPGTPNKIKNPLAVKLTFNFAGGRAVVDPGDDIPYSEDWFLKDSLVDEYCTYWFQTGFMLDIGNPDCREWYKVFKICQAMGIFEAGNAALVVDEVTKIATFTDSAKDWAVNQWEDYYVGLVINSVTGDIKWFKIISNTEDTLTFSYGDSAVLSQPYIINNEAYTGFHGLFVDDVWTTVYREGINLSQKDSNTTSTWAGDEWLEDTSKAWTDNQFAGHYISIQGGTRLQITGNDATNIWFVGNANIGAGKAYEIYEQYYHDHSRYYWQAVAEFLEDIVEYVEDKSYSLYRNWIKAERGLMMVNTWPDYWPAYAYFVAAVNKRYRHFVMFEALQSTWNMANEVTKQFIVLDWYDAKQRWDLMKVSGGVGYARLAILGYPCHQQMILSHIAGSLMLTKYSDIVEDVTAVGNIILDQLFYDMIQAGNKDSLKTIGVPITGYENYYVQDTYDRYGVMSRKFEGAVVLYNPSRQIRNINYTFDYDVVNFYTGEIYTVNTPYDLLIMPRSALFFFKNNATGEDAYNYLRILKPFTYIDANTAWIVFTSAGVTKIGTNSVWIVNGYTGLKKLTLDGTPVIPVGELSELFHSGNGTDTAVVGQTPTVENITGADVEESVLLTSKTIYAVLMITYLGTPLIPGTDYLVEQKEWDITATGKGKWNTYIFFLTDQTGKSLAVNFFEYGEEAGWPKPIVAGEQKEFGLLYRKNSGFKLQTGAVDQVDATTDLIENTDYFIIPEIARQKWDYRIQPFGVILEDKIFNATVSLNSIYAVQGNIKKKGIHWGSVDADNALLINTRLSSDYGYNGGKAEYTSKQVVKPKVLIYGFTKTVRNNSTLEAIPPASRVYDQWLFENQIKKNEGILYDAVYVTGDWDGVIQAGSDDGDYGSIRGLINDAGSGFNDVSDIAAYFDVIIINDTFIEYGVGSDSGVTQWASWMKLEDYTLIKNYKKWAIQANRNVLLIDRRAGLPAFVWYGGTVLIQNELINKQTTSPSDLTDVAGTYCYGGISIDDLYADECNLYIKTEGEQYIKYNSKMLCDFRVGKIIDATQHYNFDESKPEEHPRYNIWENGGNYISYIPKSEKGRQYIPEANYLHKMSFLYLRWYNIASLLQSDFEKYEELPLYRIPFRREPVLIYHAHDYFNTWWGAHAEGEESGTFWGLNQAETRASALDAPTLLSDAGKFRAGLLLGSAVLNQAFLLNKQMFLLESNNPDFASAFNSTDIRYQGYSGNYISALDVPTFQTYWGMPPAVLVDYGDTGWIAGEAGSLGHGGGGYGTLWYIANDIINWDNFLIFDTWNDQLQKILPISKTFNSSGCIPYKRLTPAPIEGNILSIVKNFDNTIDINVDFDTTLVTADIPLATGYITAGLGVQYTGSGFPFSSANWSYFFRVSISMSSYSGKYIYIHSGNDILVHPIGYYGHFGADSFFCSDKFGGAELVGCYFEIRNSAKTHKVLIIQPIDDRNSVFNGRISAKVDATRTLKILLPRGVDQPAAGGAVICYLADEDVEEPMGTGDLTRTVLSNRDVLGGRIAGTDDMVGVDISNAFLPEGNVDQSKTMSWLETAASKDKPNSLAHYEWAYGSLGLIKEFGYEKNTGLITCQAFYAHGGVSRPPVLIWPGISEEDVHEVINKMIGTKLVFNNLNVQAMDIIYLYYNSANDILKINSEDVVNE